MAQRMPGHTGDGPFRVDALREGDRYELSNGHPIYCAPTGGDGAGRAGIAYEVLATDPAVTEAGVDPGYRQGPKDLRAPDVGIGNVPDRPGWIAGAPELAVEVAGSGQDEADLAQKIEELHRAGTRWIWVLRVLPPRHVEVHEKGRPMETFGIDDVLTAPGVLKNPVTVRSLFEREAGHEAALRNLLQRLGYEGLDAVRGEGREAGREEGLSALRRGVLAVLSARGIAVSAEEQARVQAERSVATLERWLASAAIAGTAHGALAS